jgi:hypothetical protein
VRGACGADWNSARITGWLRRFVQPERGSPHYEQASVEQLWRWQNGRFVLAQATVGTWVVQRDD